VRARSCVCACVVSCGMAWLLSFAEVVFCIGVLGYVHSQRDNLGHCFILHIKVWQFYIACVSVTMIPVVYSGCERIK
jgi:hypothetical protein